MKWRKRAILALVLSTLLGCSNRSYNSGDRVLVTKFAYDAGVGEPNRFDVVVFKYPKTPVEGGIPKNYIKRLLGLPGQILAIFFGQLFFYEPGPDEPLPHDDHKNPNIDPLDLWVKDQMVNDPLSQDPPGKRMADFMHTNDPMHRVLFDTPGKFKILRKPPEVMLAMRRIVYDNDFPATDMTNAGLRHWDPARTGWNSDKSNGFEHTSDKADAVDWLRYQNLIRPSDDKASLADTRRELVSDFMDYNAGITLIGDHPQVDSSGANWVGDLMLECDVNVTKGEGEFWMELSKGIHRFQARFDLASGNCTLFKVRTDKDTREELGAVTTRVKGSGNYSLRLANVDARLTLWVDGDLPFGDGKEYPPPEVIAKGEDKMDPEKLKAELSLRRGPTQNDFEPASVGSKGAAVKVSHLRVWRDTHYTHLGEIREAGRNFADLKGWHNFHPSLTTMYAQPGHYICLGDNSPSSSDSREWGLVPQRLLLGRALLVYFPLNRAGPIR